MISFRVEAWSSRKGLRGEIEVRVLLLIFNLMPAIAIAQRESVQRDRTEYALAQSGQASPDTPRADGSTPANAPRVTGHSSPLAGKEEGENSRPAGENSGNGVPTGKKEKQKKERRAELIIAPLPISSPAIGTGIIPVLGYIFPMDKKDKLTPPSIVGGVGLITDNGSRALALGGELYLKRGTYQVTGIYLRGNLNYDFYGTGSAAGDAGRKLAITQTGQLFFGEGLRRIGRNFYLGPRIWMAHSEIMPDLSKSDKAHPIIPEPYLNTDVRAVGARLLRDTRPNRFYPTGGTFFDFKSNFFFVSPNAGVTSGETGSPGSSQAGHFSFQSYRLTFNKYAGLGDRQVLAYNLFLCAANGEAPFYGQCIFGTNNELRGYVAARYIDRRMFATQLEYRLELPMRLGLAAFGGVGEVAPTVAKFRYDELLPSVGGGVRFNLSKRYHVNLRLDLAKGKNDHTWSMGVGEAF